MYESLIGRDALSERSVTADVWSTHMVYFRECVSVVREGCFL